MVLGLICFVLGVGLLDSRISGFSGLGFFGLGLSIFFGSRALGFRGVGLRV